MTFRATGPGLIEVNPAYSGTGVLRALLYNFDFDDTNVTELKSEHAGFLRISALPLLANNRGMILLLGQASQVGANAYNLQLSRQRVQRVVDFLTRSGVTRSQIRPDAVGEEQSVSRLRDDPRDRSVEFVITPKRVPLPRVVPPPPPMSTRFRLRLVGDITLSGAPRLRPRPFRVGVGPATDAMMFEIQDVENNVTAFYGYSGLGAGAGFNAAWLSGTDTGPWNPFTTSAPMNVGDFGGPSRFTTGGGGDYTANWLHLLGTPEGVDAVYLGIDTGRTYGVGISTTAGPLQLIYGPVPAGSP